MTKNFPSVTVNAENVSLEGHLASVPRLLLGMWRRDENAIHSVPPSMNKIHPREFTLERILGRYSHSAGHEISIRKFECNSIYLPSSCNVGNSYLNCCTRSVHRSCYNDNNLTFANLRQRMFIRGSTYPFPQDVISHPSIPSAPALTPTMLLNKIFREKAKFRL